ncbi:membrane metallo-endopeptidase-like 1 [Teleopsis dalmanni]|uniref:membrane metallo-endopeptidase-like 1 n=1 Tax=Teleopsis dalmanni TaxID=139649 RepID=UPI0018CCB654|nr:membrane metallo-endopeptidase-like 1 [Teleopsis dalmanni]
MLVAKTHALLSTVFIFLIVLRKHIVVCEDADDFARIFRQGEQVRKNKGKEVLKYMNLSADPCKDFYEFSCGNWGKHNTVKEDEIKTPLSLLNTKINNDLISILEDQVTVDDGNTGRKIKTFYKSCTNAQRNGLTQEQFFSKFIKNNGGFPAVPASNWLIEHHNYNWQEIVSDLNKKYNTNILIGLKIDLNPYHIQENTLYIVNPNTIIPDHLCNAQYTEHTVLEALEYEVIEADVVENLISWLGMKSNDAKKIAFEILSFEFELCKAINLNVSEETNIMQYKKYPRNSLTEFSQKFNENINFDQFVRNSLGSPYYKPVIMTNEHYINALINTTEQHNKSTIANYIMYSALSLLSLPKDTDKSVRPRFCLDTLKRHLPEILSDMYRKKYSSISIRSEVLTLYDRLKNSFQHSLQNTWIADSSSRAGQRRLSEINLNWPKLDTNNLNVQFDIKNYWNNLEEIMSTVQPKHLTLLFSLENAQPSNEVFAYETRLAYKHTHRRIDISWGSLQTPYYRELYPSAMRHALIGQPLAEELSKAFDDINWTEDFLGIPHWDRHTEKEYAARSECFRTHTSNYMYNNPEIFQNETLLREIIAKNIGVNISFKTYLDWLTYLNPQHDHDMLSRETLAELNFTNTQLFFITYAQMNCQSKKDDKQNERYDILFEQTLESFKVNGPLQNSEEFARDFRCAKGTVMNPDNKCVIY